MCALLRKRNESHADAACEISVSFSFEVFFARGLLGMEYRFEFI
jgi:hypothetical protein